MGAKLEELVQGVGAVGVGYDFVAVFGLQPAVV